MIDEPEEKFVIQAGKLFVEESGLTGSRKIDEGAVAYCDLCSVILGAYKDIKYDYSPEAFARAVRNGLLPTDTMHRRIALAQDIPYSKIAVAEVNEFWKELALNSETRWVVCENCKSIVESFLRKDKK